MKRNTGNYLNISAKVRVKRKLGCFHREIQRRQSEWNFRMAIQIFVKKPEEKPKLVNKWRRKEKMVQKLTQGNKCWLWRYLGNSPPPFFVIGEFSNLIVLLLQNQSKSYRYKEVPHWLVGCRWEHMTSHTERSVWQESPDVPWWCIREGALGPARPSDVQLAEIRSGRRLGLLTQSTSWPWRSDAGRRPARWRVQWGRTLKRCWSTELECWLTHWYPAFPPHASSCRQSHSR